MHYPLVLSDKFDLERLIMPIIRETAKKTANQVLIQTGLVKPMMTKAECYRLSSRRKVDGAISTHKLKCVKKGGNVWIKREHFDQWLNKNDFEL